MQGIRRPGGDGNRDTVAVADNVSKLIFDVHNEYWRDRDAGRRVAGMGGEDQLRGSRRIHRECAGSRGGYVFSSVGGVKRVRAGGVERQTAERRRSAAGGDG